MKELQLIAGQTFEIDYTPLAEHRDLKDIYDSGSEITDVSGVPLESDRTNPPEGLDFEYKPCPYSESPTRYPNGASSPIPMSGLEQRRLAQNFPQIRRELLASRAAYLSLAGLGRGHTMSTLDANIVLCVLQVLPLYLTERAVDPLDKKGALPEFVIVGSNAASGALGAIGAYTHGRATLQKRLGDGASVLEAAEGETSGGLVGQKTVCAASPTMIRQFLNLVKEGSSTITFGNIEDETRGLLKRNEFVRALSMGLRMESMLMYNTVIQMADSKLISLLIGYKPKRHNPRHLRPAIEDFRQTVNDFTDEFMDLSRGVNIALNRVSERPGERDRMVNQAISHTTAYRLAKTKGIDISPSVK